MKFVRHLDEIGENDRHHLGGKAWWLARMTKAGLPIPPALVLTTQAQQAYFSSINFTEVYKQAMDRLAVSKEDNLSQISVNLQSAILDGEIPEILSQELMNSFNQIGETAIAVRSSATVEDGQKQAWAGQFETVLNVRKDRLELAVKRCWASLFYKRALEYSAAHSQPAGEARMAIVLQKMIDCRSAGVAFSIHPVSEIQEQIVIESVYGLGEALVGGKITPQTYIVDRSKLTVIDKHLPQQSKALYPLREGGVGWIDLQGSDLNPQILNDELILELGQHVLAAEKMLGAPCDVEWGFDGKKLYIFQARPITTLSG